MDKIFLDPEKDGFEQRSYSNKEIELIAQFLNNGDTIKVFDNKGKIKEETKK